MAASPYWAAAWLSSSVARHASTCRLSDGEPPRTISPKSRRRQLRWRGATLSVPPRRLMASSRAKLRNWQNTVAMAAPAMPQPATKMSSGASAMLSSAPLTIPTMA